MTAYPPQDGFARQKNFSDGRHPMRQRYYLVHPSPPLVSATGSWRGPSAPVGEKDRDEASDVDQMPISPEVANQTGIIRGVRIGAEYRRKC